MTVHEVVMVALERAQPTRFMRTVAGLGARADGRRAKDAENLLGALGLISYRDSKILELSTGTRRIAELACLIALEPVLLLLDEPSSGIAQRETEALGHVLSDIREQLDMTMVIIEHDIPLLMGLSDRVVAMESGAVIAVGSPAEVQANPRVISSYLGGDVRAIERSARTGRVGPEDSDRDERCAALTRTGVPCQRKAGPGGVCAQHGRVLSRT
jgi:ABC-type branched-subunit amino acid transport system ATPase component